MGDRKRNMKIVKLTIALLSFAIVGMIYGTTFGSTFDRSSTGQKPPVLTAGQTYQPKVNTN
ncbi:MAG: hypothetical protein HY879_22240 [Deltaproteobacteria bacterium]|nr:hypothetical protein [Deltaproteobacteria bacterium]